jgi:type III secretion protein C
MRRFFLVLMGLTTLFATEHDGHTINFQDVPAIEFVRFVSRIAGVNFIYNQNELLFNISLSTGKAISSDQVVQALVQILKVHGLSVLDEEGYLVVHKTADLIPIEGEMDKNSEVASPLSMDQLYASLEPMPPVNEEPPKYLVHKLQYHLGGEIEETIKKIASDQKGKLETPPKYLNALQSVQWVKTTNSLVCSGDEESLNNVKSLIESLDVPLRQVFIEVLVIEIDVRKSVDFGLQWAAGGQLQDGVGFAAGSFPPSTSKAPFASAFQGVNASNPPTGPSQIPLGSGFDMGVIGDLIMHKGRSFLSLGSLVSALQIDGDSTIVLNQKIITQDNKNSTIFVGDNIPFTGSVVSTVGTGQQTTANVEYRDIGVMLSITPKLGEGDTITLDINEEISEAVPNMNAPISGNHVNGIQTTKTNMVTHVHVPDKHFLVLSGMIRNSKTRHKAGLPCLGGLPWIGAAFSKNRKSEEKRNVIIFVRPHIIRSMDDYRKLTQNQEEQYRKDSQPADLSEALRIAQ